MSSQHSTERLIDLLYGELTPEEEAEVREELGESAVMRAELDGLESLLGDVRTAMPQEDVPTSVHSSILEAARTAANQAPAGTPRRRPEGSEPAGLWGRIFEGQGSQFALVAAVLIAGVFVAKFVGDSANTVMAPAADISAASEPAPPPAPVATPMQAVELAESELADESAPPTPEKPVTAQLAEPMAPAEPEPAPQPAARDRELARQQRADAPVEKKPRARSTSRRATRGTIAAPSTLATGGPRDDADTRAKERRAAQKASSLHEVLLHRQAEREPAPEPTAAPMAAKAEAKPAADGAQPYRPQPGTLAAVEQRARANDYNGAITASDQFLAADTGSATERARALQLKADALLKLGRYAEADRIYESIQKNYPTYQTTAVNSARATIQERQNRQPARRKRAAPEAESQRPASYDADSIE